MSTSELSNLCLLCLEKESTGAVVQMCDKCFEAFESKIEACKIKGVHYEPTDREMECLHPKLRYKSDGGDIDESVDVLFVREGDEPTKIIFKENPSGEDEASV